MYTLGQAAKEVGCSKGTISRAISKGRLSASKGDDGSYSIDPAELHRWMSSNGRVNPQSKRTATANETPETPHLMGEMQAKLDAAERLAAERERTIEDLRRRLDVEGEERRKLTAMLTDQRTAPEPTPEPPRGFWARLRGR